MIMGHKSWLKSSKKYHGSVEIEISQLMRRDLASEQYEQNKACFMRKFVGEISANGIYMVQKTTDSLLFLEWF